MDYDYFIHLSALTDASNSLKFKKYLENNLSTKRIVNFCQKNDKDLYFPQVQVFMESQRILLMNL